MEGHINVTSDIRAFYAIMEDPSDELVYQPFPGYNNLLSSGQIIDPAKNNGQSDTFIAPTNEESFNAFERRYFASLSSKD